MVSHGVFLDVMKIVKFHHRGHLDGFVYDRFMRVCRVRYLLARCDFQLDGVRSETGYPLCVDFEPSEVSDPREQIRRIEPSFMASGCVYDMRLCVDYEYGLARQALGREDESWLSFCLEAYRLLLIEDGFREASSYWAWCDIRQRHVSYPVSFDDCFLGGSGCCLPCMSGRRATYAAWSAKVRA